jgi:hypothetical protein
MISTEQKRDIQEKLSQLFGSYKAEWLREQMFDLFTEPSYFPELLTARPCMLIGGRGTGKTTVLRSLSYDGQFVLRGRDPQTISAWPYYGIYYRVNTNRVTAFHGPELTQDRWIKVFAHYFNLLMCDSTLRFLEWYNLHTPNSPQLSAAACTKLSKSLNLQDFKTLRELGDGVECALIAFEAYINNVADRQPMALSVQGSPLDILFEQLAGLAQFKGKHFFLLLDEYENFEDYQQQIINTLIKHSGQLYTFKIGVKELGWRRRTTLNENEQLISPADYVKVSIMEKLESAFEDFALKVCNDRISLISADEESGGGAPDIKTLFPDLTDEEEAELLDKTGTTLRDCDTQIRTAAPQSSDVHIMPSLEKLFLCFWAKTQEKTVAEVVEARVANPAEWKMRYGNYKHSLLFALRRGKAGIRKYYAGWSVFTQLASCNIRYILELVEQSLLLHLQNEASITEPVSYENQTIAAQKVGKKNLSELEGLSVHGAQLTKLLLGLGRIFQTLAADSSGHTPEVTQFHLQDAETSPELNTAVQTLLTSAVMHLALIRLTGNKPQDDADTREYDYMVHPIFSAFFVFSYRRKRKMLIAPEDILALIERPKATIRKILNNQNRLADEPLPEQLRFFEQFYNADS